MAEENNKLNIEEALNRLEEINKRLSAKDISLEESLKLYNEGTELAAKCQEQLKGVEQELEVLNLDETK